MKRSIKLIKRLVIYMVVVITLFFIVSSGNKTETIYIENLSSVKSIQAAHLVSKYNPKLIKTTFVNSFAEVLKYASSMPVKFNGSMTGYGPDCAGCTGKTACPPRQDVRNGNVYFNDHEYGKTYILATDSRIPCGTIIKITGSSLGNEAIGIALDRGGAINNTLMDFLVDTESTASRNIGRQYVQYEIVRWGW